MARLHKLGKKTLSYLTPLQGLLFLVLPLNFTHLPVAYGQSNATSSIVLTRPATNITGTAATLNLTLAPSPGQYFASARFEYGPTTTYGYQGSLKLDSTDGTTGQDLSYALVGLLPHTTYHFRAVVTNSSFSGGGTLFGKDLTFTTSDTPLPSTNQTVATWGGSSYGTLGDGSVNSRPLPTDIAGKGALSGKTIIGMASGQLTAFAWCSDGTVAAWGWNISGMLGDGTNIQRELPVNITGQGALKGRKISKILPGFQWTLALCTDGTVLGWGNTASFLLGKSSNGIDPWTPILIQGALVGKKVTQLVGGENHALALCSDGTLAAWGNNINGAFGNGNLEGSIVPITVEKNGSLTGKTIVQIAAVGPSNLALCSDGTLASWGFNYYGQIGDGTTTDRTLPVDISNQGVLKGKRVTQIFSGYASNFALCSDGTLATWGWNKGGQLGDGTTIDRTLPIAITNSGALKGKKISKIANYAFHTLALFTDGSIAAWGKNDGGVVGDGTTTTRLLPVDLTNKGVLKDKKITDIAAGGSISMALATSGSPPQNQAPQASITSPTPNQVLSPHAFTGDTIKGTATDDAGVTKVEIKLYRARGGVNQVWNGVSFSSTVTTVAAETSGSGTNITWKIGQKAPTPNQLDTGEYQFIVYATDAAGKTGTARTTFTLEGPSTDTIKPIVNISAPTTGQTLLLTDVISNSIRGRASDNVGVLKVDLKLYRSRGGVNQVWNGTSFSTTVATVPAELSGPTTDTAWSLGAKTPPQNLLDAGEYQLIAYATDAAGNTSATRTTFTLAVSGSSS